ncbi:hypothetical protein D3C77_291700 [compost metagenome]
MPFIGNIEDDCFFFSDQRAFHFNPVICDLIQHRKIIISGSIMDFKNNDQLVLLRQRNQILNSGQTVFGPLLTIGQYNSNRISSRCRNRRNRNRFLTFIPCVSMIYAPHHKRISVGVIKSRTIDIKSFMRRCRIIIRLNADRIAGFRNIACGILGSYREVVCCIGRETRHRIARLRASSCQSSSVVNIIDRYAYIIGRRRPCKTYRCTRLGRALQIRWRRWCCCIRYRINLREFPLLLGIAVIRPLLNICPVMGVPANYIQSFTAGL